MKRTVYVNPGDMLEIKVIDDPELPRNNKEWMYQIRPGKILLTIAGRDHIKLIHGIPLTIEETTPKGETVYFR